MFPVSDGQKMHQRSEDAGKSLLHIIAHLIRLNNVIYQYKSFKADIT